MNVAARSQSSGVMTRSPALTIFVPVCAMRYIGAACDEFML